MMMLKKIPLKQLFIGPMRAAIWGCSFLILLSCVVYMVAAYAIDKELEVRLMREYARVQDQISNRMQVYANSMLAIRSFLYNLENSNQEQLNLYIEDMQLFERYPGMKAIGYAELLSRAELTDNAYRLSRLVSNFTLDQYSIQSNNYAIATSIYPVDLMNQKVLGFDMMSEEKRKNALVHSILSDKPILSEVVKFKQDKDETGLHTSMLLFFPVYKENDPRAPRTLQNTSGVLFISLRTLDFFSAIFGDQSLLREKSGFSIEMVTKGTAPVKLYDRFEIKQKPKISITKTFDIFGETFRLYVYPLDSFYTYYDILFPWIISLLSLLLSALIFLNIRNNANYAGELRKSNTLLNRTLLRQEEKQEDLTILNRTLQRMNHSLDTDKIVESFIQGVSEIFESKGKFAIYSTSRSENDNQIRCHLISSNDDAFFVEECSIPVSTYTQLFASVEDSLNFNPSMDLGFLVNNPRSSFEGMCSKIEASAFGSSAFTVFINTANEIEESESVLFEALMKHFNTSIQNSLLLKKVEDANQSKNAFLANMSHEIRTPLNALMGFSEIIIRDDVDVQAKKNLASNIIRNGKQLTRLVDDILDLSKIEAGKILIDKRRIDLFELLGEVKSIMNMRIDREELEFKIEVDGKIPQFIEMDPIRLKQILTNLIGNSIKFTEKGLVRLRLAYQDENVKRPMLIFRVEDTGIGIDREFRTRLFLPFSQADSTSTRKFAGTGLGLAISRRLASELGGSLTLVFSEKDIGSIFELAIPVEKTTNQVWTETPDLTESEITHGKYSKKGNLKKKNILLVEDSPDNQDFFNFFLTQAGGNVKIVSSGLDAVDEASKSNYDIILMDIQIPGIDGKEATRRIRSQGYDGPIVALTAHAMQEEQSSCLQAGCNGQISKPVSGEVLVSQVYNFIKGPHATTR